MIKLRLVLLCLGVLQATNQTSCTMLAFSKPRDRLHIRYTASPWALRCLVRGNFGPEHGYLLLRASDRIVLLCCPWAVGGIIKCGLVRQPSQTTDENWPKCQGRPMICIRTIHLSYI